jgi:predicted Zn-dependent protease
MGDVLKSAPDSPRLTILKSFAEKRPQDPFPRYALAMELKTAGDLPGAWQVLQALIADHPGYVASYAPASSVLGELGQASAAREVLKKGIAAAGRQNEDHTRAHLETMLADLDPGSEGEGGATAKGEGKGEG